MYTSMANPQNQTETFKDRSPLRKNYILNVILFPLDSTAMLYVYESILSSYRIFACVILNII